jgi:NodT family efflux transporter outer membrane factor (OMF) lipoprotein
VRGRAASLRAAATAAAALGAALLGACVGPRYNPPKLSAPGEFKEATAGAWQVAQPQDAVLKGKWWEMFNEPELNGLEEQLNINNQNIAQYFQNFMAARAQVREANAGYYPTLSTSPAYSRARTPGTLSGTAGSGAQISSEYALPFDVSWEPDLWGRVRNTVHEYQYAAQVSAADLENERLSEQANLAQYYFELRGQDALQAVYDRTIEADTKSVQLTRALFETGIDSEQDVAEAEVTLANAQAGGAGVATNRALYEHAIATLIGRNASEFSLPVKTLSTAVPPIPLGIPSALLQRRPDVAAAERTMAQANALIGVEETAYYPNLTITAGAGFESSVLSSLLSAPARFWSLGATASETIFDAGLRQATVAQYTAAYNGDVAAYRQTVLTAFQQVEDYTATLRVLNGQIALQQAAVAAAQRYLDIENSRYDTGLDPYLDVMIAETTLLSDQLTEVTLRVSQMSAAVELIQALGGGWDLTQLPSASKITNPGTERALAAPP